MKKSWIWMAGIAACALLLLLVGAWLVWTKSLRPVDKYIAEEKRKMSERESVKFVEKRVGRINRKEPNMRQYTNIMDATSVAFYRGHYFIGTTGGLLELDKNLSSIGVYTNLNGLLENHITALKVFKGDLFRNEPRCIDLR